MTLPSFRQYVPGAGTGIRRVWFEAALASLWLIISVPYIVNGGMLRDDLGLSAMARNFATFPDFLGALSASPMTSPRPLSNLIGGAAYWHCGSAPAALHAFNLTLVLFSVVLFFRAMERIVSRDDAMTASVLALLFPCSASALFAGATMGANLAAVFWAAALLCSTRPGLRHVVCTSVLLIASSLSYEAFVPLFLATAAVGWFRTCAEEGTWRRAAKSLVPVAVAWTVPVLLYTAAGNASIHPGDVRIEYPPLLDILPKFAHSVVLGSKAVFVDSSRILRKASFNMDLVPPLQHALWITLLAFLILLASISRSRRMRAIDGRLHNATQNGRPTRAAVRWIAWAACFFAAAHIIFVFSRAWPDPTGFENRVLIAFRFTTAFLVSHISALVVSWGRGRFMITVHGAVVFAIAALCAVSVFGQREAWIAAAQFNRSTGEAMVAAIRKEGIDRRKTLRLVAVLPSNFPGQVNREPVLGREWDVTGLLTGELPGMRIYANAADTSAAADVFGLRIHGYWYARYPFWMYTWPDSSLVRITSRADWDARLLSGTMPRH